MNGAILDDAKTLINGGRSEAHGHRHDNLLDAAGYIGLAGDLAE